MRSERSAVFLIDLLQDVNILRPLMLLARVDLAMPVRILMSLGFLRRDTAGIWQAELSALANDAGVTLHRFETEYEAWRLLAGGHGLLVSASETDQPGHRTNHSVFRIAPADYLRVTIQHGYECLGFLPNREHVRAHGLNIHFAADVICGWCEADRMTGVVPSERNKLYVAGSPLVLSRLQAGVPVAADSGLVCENLHSVRLRVSGDFRMSFMDTFFAFCGRLAEQGERVTLRPHPGGQYFQKNAIALPATVDMQNAPAYQVDFARYTYGISAPSTVLIDMLLAGVPTAVWQDEGQVMDAGKYMGLPIISTLSEWLAFRHAARTARDGMLAQQADFLRRSGLLTDPAEVRRRFLALFAGGGQAARGQVATPAPKRARRVMFVCNAHVQTLQVSFLKPLQSLRDTGEIDWYLAVENDLHDPAGEKVASSGTWATMRKLFDQYAPDILVLCRYSGKHAEDFTAHARAKGVPTIYHIDDDLLGVPAELGEAKWKMHNHPARLASVRHLLNACDVVYVSTESLHRRFRELGITRPMRVGAIYCAASILNLAEPRPVRRVGYMGFKHSHDFEVVVPALLRYLDRHPDVTFELFGTVPKPLAFDRFGERFRVVPPVPDYTMFTTFFASLNWDIGLCALATSPFNAAKANTKWVEYTSVGAAVIASGDTIYDGCTADGCGLLATNEAQWFDALERLTVDQDFRFAMVRRAQDRIEQDYTVARLREQVLAVLDEATQLTAARAAAAATPWRAIGALVP